MSHDFAIPDSCQPVADWTKDVRICSSCHRDRNQPSSLDIIRDDDADVYSTVLNYISVQHIKNVTGKQWYETTDIIQQNCLESSSSLMNQKNGERKGVKVMGWRSCKGKAQIPKLSTSRSNMHVSFCSESDITSIAKYVNWCRNIFETSNLIQSFYFHSYSLHSSFMHCMLESWRFLWEWKKTGKKLIRKFPKDVIVSTNVADVG